VKTTKKSIGVWSKKVPGISDTHLWKEDNRSKVAGCKVHPPDGHRYNRDYCREKRVYVLDNQFENKLSN
jgi:hypothetical protein